jgi:hypothetical protein
VLSGKHPAWFNQFISNLSSQFESADAEGAVRIVEQRPADALPDLGDDQLRHFTHGILEQFMQKMELLKTP